VQGHIITIEITSGEVYRGKLLEGALHSLASAIDISADKSIAEDNMNVQLKDITVTARDGRVSHLEQVYIRGSHVRYFIVPDMLRYGIPSEPAVFENLTDSRNAPMFRSRGTRGRGVGLARGRATVNRARASTRGGGAGGRG
jgi:small nuclear ribonucleoprotein D3